VAIKASAAACAIGKTVVEPLTLSVCFGPEVAGAVVRSAEFVCCATGACGVVIAVIAGTDVNVLVLFALLVQPATTIARIRSVVRLNVAKTLAYVRLFIVFIHEMIGCEYTFFRQRI
jgi:hypothetical protein